MKEVGIEFIKPSAADAAKVAEGTDQIIAKWVKEMEAKKSAAVKWHLNTRSWSASISPFPSGPNRP